MALLLLLLSLSGHVFGQTPNKETYKNWVTYVPGRDSLIIAAPHGGLLEPPELQARQNGCLNGSVCVYKQGCTPQTRKCKATTVTDSHTDIIADMIAENLRKKGIYPHVITCHVKRPYVDMNRAISSACFGMKECEKVYNAYHGFIEKAIASMNGFGLFADMHGQGHAANWTELGYRITKTQLNSGNYSDIRSSIHHLKLRSGYSLQELLTGRSSMGHFLSQLGYRAVPSGAIPKPNSGGYYRGGYCTMKYGSELEGRCMDAIQFEMAPGIRLTGASTREKTARDFATAMQQFYELHNYGENKDKCSSSADQLHALQQARP